MAARQLVNMTYSIAAEAECSSACCFAALYTAVAGTLPATQLGRPCYCIVPLSTSLRPAAPNCCFRTRLVWLLHGMDFSLLL